MLPLRKDRFTPHQALAANAHKPPERSHHCGGILSLVELRHLAHQHTVRSQRETLLIPHDAVELGSAGAREAWSGAGTGSSWRDGNGAGAVELP